ncbi:MAG TPA: glycosyl hydrolase 115 family protein, partial [Puia sp.]|nr:glycosyl hydrolase 115 family protein [Puia sp.]
KPMTEGTAISLLEKIVKKQREIIQEVTQKPAPETPQVWALYKEVQDYYDKGMRVPDDVTLLLCDDNWGNIRRLPKRTDAPRSGGYGIYYHFDYVGDPRNYKWLNTNQIERTWEQMHLAFEYGVNRIWIVNVGDLKPMEFPISFFLDYAWNPTKWNEDNLQNYYTHWAAQQFGNKYATQIGKIIQKYTQYNARRKPELLSPETYNLINYNEAAEVVKDYDDLLAQAEKINKCLPTEYKDAFFELVLHPVKACANLNKLYTAVAWNRFCALQNLTAANRYAYNAKQLYINDSLISIEYNSGIAHGKWNHMMDQTHIGYTYWQQPPFNKMPEVAYVSKDSLIQNDDPFEFRASSQHLVPKNGKGNLFYEENGLVSINAAHCTKAVSTKEITWKAIQGFGRANSAITTFPVTARKQVPGVSSPFLQYEMYTYDSGSLRINAYFSPTLNFLNDTEGLQYGISIDGEKPQIISINKEDNNKKIWEGWVADNIIIKTTSHAILSAGRHTLKYWMVSPAVILQKIVIDFGGVKQSYLGPPETLMK